MSREQLFSIMVNKTPMLGSYILSIELEDGSGYCFNVKLQNGTKLFVRCQRPNIQTPTCFTIVSK